MKQSTPYNDSWPSHLRVTSIVRLPAKIGRGIQNVATLFHEHLTVRVSWRSAHVDTRIRYGSIVQVKGVPRQIRLRMEDPVPVDRLELVDQPVAALNIFSTVPDAWCSDHTLLEEAKALWEGLNRPMQHLLNAVLWDGARLRRFTTGPAGLSDHPSQPGGNFRLAVRLANQAQQLVKGLTGASRSTVCLAALLSRIGRADDYRHEQDHFALSDRGYWVGGHYTILEWLAVARTKVAIPDEQYLALIHAMIGSRSGPSERQSIEATVLAVANKLDAPSSFTAACQIGGVR